MTEHAIEQILLPPGTYLLNALKMPPQLKTTQQKKKKDRKPDPTEWPGLKTDQLATLGKKIKTHFNWEHEPRTFQLNAIKGQLQRQDVLIHAGTGSGKTVVAAGPHVYDETKGMVTFMVAPLIVLQDEHVSARILSGNYHLHTGVR